MGALDNQIKNTSNTSSKQVKSHPHKGQSYPDTQRNILNENGMSQEGVQYPKRGTHPPLLQGFN